MRIAALYDIHGNLPALEAVLSEIDERDVDMIVFGGDLCWGPLPAETLRRILAVDQPTSFVRGNADREMGLRLGVEEGLEGWVAEINLWGSDRLSSVERDSLAGLPTWIKLEIDELGPVLFCHGSPRNDAEAMTPYTASSEIDKMLVGTPEQTIVCGHTHVQFTCVSGGVRIVNPGSVGLPTGEVGAQWAILGPDVEFLTTPYDLELASSLIEAGGCPDARGFVEHIKHPPASEPHLRRFADQ